MQEINQNVVCKELAPYLKQEGLKSTSSLLQSIRQALQDIKKEKPCLSELEITEIAFLRDQKNGIILKVYFDASPAAIPENI